MIRRLKLNKGFGTVLVFLCVRGVALLSYYFFLVFNSLVCCDLCPECLLAIKVYCF